MSSDPAITTLIISATYVAVVSFGEQSSVISGSPYNPATAFGLFFGILFDGDVKDTPGVWIFLFFAYAGAVLAILLFEFVYKKAIVIVENNGEGVSDDDEAGSDDGAQHMLPQAMQEN